jgi:HK97 family phage major capsid protein
MFRLEEVRAALRQLLDERAQRQARLDEITDTAEAEGRSALTDAETTEHAEIRQALRDLDERRAELTAREAELVDEADRRAAAEAQARALPTGADTARGGVRVVRNEPIYRKGGEHSFLRDLYARDMHRGDITAAAERLHRHEQAVLEQRATAVSGMAGAIPPVYLVDEYANVARAGRPFLNSLNVGSLPDEGVSFIVPPATTGTTGAQTAEAATFQDGDLAVSNVTNTVELTTAKTDVSRTLFERGGGIVDEILFPDLMAACEVALNTSAVNGSGTTPQHRGVLQVSGISAVTYTDASPTVGELWPKLSDAIQRINSNRFMPATAIYMHPRRWGWITAAVDTTGRPLFDFSTTPPNVVMGLGVAAEYGQVVGKLQGLPVVTDATIPTNLGAGTNEDIIFVARTVDLRYFEDDMMQFTFEQAVGATAPGQVRLAVGRFALAIFGRYPLSISTIGGTGLVTPTF